MPVANNNAVTYAELKDEQIKDIKKGIELFVKTEEYWDKFAHHSSVPRGHRTFTSRKLIAPKIKVEDIKPRAEFVAPRPTKISVATFEKTVANYGDKAIYSKEDLQFHYDDTVMNIMATLKEIAVQKKDLVKGTAFIQSRATVTYDTSILNTCEKTAIILRKNGAKRVDGVHYLAHITPEGLKQLRAELSAKGVVLSEPVKKELDSVATSVGSYGDFTFSVTTSPIMYKNATTQYIIFMGKRGIDGEYPVDVSKLEGESDIEVINNGLGSGVLIDEDGNYTSDDNKQQGSVAINIDGLGAAVSDDLCILPCEVSINEIKESALPLASRTGYASHSGNELEVTLTGTSYTEFSGLKGIRYDATATKYYASGSTIVAATVVAKSTKTLGSVTAANWSATYKLENGGSDINAEILAIIKTTADNDTIIVRVPDKAYSFEIECEATAS